MFSINTFSRFHV